MNRDLMNLNILALLAMFILALLLLTDRVFAAEPPRSPNVRTLYLSEDTIARADISPRGTVLSFPVKPAKVLLGQDGSFHVEYIENDLAISPRSAGSRSNLFVYILGRRFTLDLAASPGCGYAIINVRDAKERRIKIGDPRER